LFGTQSISAFNTHCFERGGFKRFQIVVTKAVEEIIMSFLATAKKLTEIPVKPGLNGLKASYAPAGNKGNIWRISYTAVDNGIFCK